MGWSEESLHRFLAKRKKPSVVVGSWGHDGAVLAGASSRAVTCVDACVMGVHFDRGTAPRLVGHKAAARALSDLAACAAEPRALLLALRAPKRAEESYLRSLITALGKTGEAFGAPLVGGDTTCADGPLSLTVTALGALPGRAQPVGRDRATSGQAILLTGPVGGSLLGRHLKIEPRIAAGQTLAKAGATVLMDVSDGLALDLARIGKASKVRMVLDEIPIHRDAMRRAKKSGRSAMDHALGDGEDHELIACLSERKWRAKASELQRDIPNLTKIGSVQRGRGLELSFDSELSWEEPPGWRHG